MGGTEGSQAVRWSKSLKAILSSDCRLKLAYMKLELLVIANANAAVIMFPGLVQADDMTSGSWRHPKPTSTFWEKSSKVESITGVKWITRWPSIGRCGWITCFLGRIICCSVLKVYTNLIWGCSSVGRALALQARGQSRISSSPPFVL